ncbi:MAG: hypothetical protein ACE363_02370 [Alphaproteobacteria bacterium]
MSSWLTIKRLYGLGALITLVYLLFFDGFVYSHGNWMTQVPASVFTALVWPAYWGVIRWI